MFRIKNGKAILYDSIGYFGMIATPVIVMLLMVALFGMHQLSMYPTSSLNELNNTLFRILLAFAGAFLFMIALVSFFAGYFKAQAWARTTSKSFSWRLMWRMMVASSLMMVLFVFFMTLAYPSLQHQQYSGAVLALLATMYCGSVFFGLLVKHEKLWMVFKKIIPALVMEVGVFGFPNVVNSVLVLLVLMWVRQLQGALWPLFFLFPVLAFSSQWGREFIHKQLSK